LEKLEEASDLREVKNRLAGAKKQGTIPWKKIKKDAGL
jgi:hypothetical protein